jgi:hypothetical protein
MKHLRQICLVATLVFTFTFSAYAGEIECPGITASSQATEALPGNNNIPPANSTNNGGTTNTIAGDMLANVLLLMLALV